MCTRMPLQACVSILARLYNLWFDFSQGVTCSDSDWVGDFDTRQSTSGNVSFWVIHVSLGYVWLRRLLAYLHSLEEGPTPILIDSESAIAIAWNLVFHAHMKHIEIHYHYV